MSSQTPMTGTTEPTDTVEPTDTAATTHTTAGEVVSRFLTDLRRHDLDALALLLRAERSPDQSAEDAAAPADEAQERAARDCAQVVLRSFSGSGLVETERHTSTDGQTVFVEFGRRPGPTGFPEQRTGVRLLRFSTAAGTITGITEYAHPFAGAPADQGRPVAVGGRRAGDGLAWPSLAAVRPADPPAAER